MIDRVLRARFVSVARELGGLVLELRRREEHAAADTLTKLHNRFTTFATTILEDIERRQGAPRPVARRRGAPPELRLLRGGRS